MRPAPGRTDYPVHTSHSANPEELSQCNFSVLPSA